MMMMMIIDEDDASFIIQLCVIPVLMYIYTQGLSVPIALMVYKLQVGLEAGE